MVIFNKKTAWLVVFCFSSLMQAFAQPSIKTTIDKNGILIGEQLKLKVVATLPKQDFFVKWVDIPDSLGHFDIVEKSKIDSTFTNQKLIRLSQTITLTSFDSGKWVMPSFDIDFNPVNGDSAYHFFTDTFPVTVSYQPDSSNIIRDIKPVREANEEKPIWYWIVAAVGVLVLIVLGVWLYYYLKKKKKPVIKGPSLTAYQQAMQGMEKLKQVDLSDTAGIKIYHTKLTEILKEYLSDKQGPYFTSSTTAEVLMLLNQQGLDKTNLTKTAEALRCSDAAKFAKYIPVVQESEASWAAIKYAIDFSEQLNSKTEAGVS